MNVSSRLKGSLLLLAVGSILCVIALSDPDSISPFAFLFGIPMAVVGFVGLFGK